jgi:acyl carrier protein phosphodiesterase
LLKVINTKNSPPTIEQGILLHREIDYFTDLHQDVKMCKDKLRPGYGKYAGIVTDIFFDHFLASNWDRYSKYTLRNYTEKFHSVLLSHYHILPLRTKILIPFLIRNRRLESYAQFEGVEISLEIMGRRTSLPQKTPYAMIILEQEYSFFNEIFSSFFEELIEFAEEEGKFKIARP